MTTTESPRHAGLSSAEAARLLEQHGPNQLAAAEVVPAWKKFLAQFKDMLILILIAAALVSLVVSGEVKTPLVVLVVVVFNAVIGFVQENRAEKSLDALRKMLTAQVRVRRDGTVMMVPTESIVPGDVVLVEAGDRLPADGEIFFANNLEVDEAALTGESHPVEKNTEPVDPNAPIGDRHSHAFMNTTVTRGRGEILVTKTGMGTEIGRIAGLLASTPTEKTPLQRQLDGLAHQLVYLAGIVVALVMITNLARGQSFGDVLLTAVALAVASIPEGLPAVTVVTLAIGVSKLASQNAIIKRLAAVETLGCTSVICSDKTGTLTLNQMTSTKFLFDGRIHEVTGSGYSASGSVEGLSAASSDTLATAARGLALCADAVVHHHGADTNEGADELVGDPTEGALVVLAEKLGVNVAQVRGEYPRIAEVPFDSATKYMATVHRFPIPGGGSLVRIYVKGAPDVVMSRCNQVLWMHDTADMATQRAALDAHYDAMAADGLRVLALAVRQFPDAEWDEFVSGGGKVVDLLSDLTLVSLVGIVDPPRPEARVAIAEALSAGIAVKMITGDHAVTAASIGKQLGIEGRAVTGADIERMTDDELRDQIDEIGVFARVAPEHKMRLVGLLQSKQRVVAMTGDGVNDAPALKKSDMGVAMGITGTEVSKEAATMVLTDDNFATIVGAVRQGRSIYHNIVSFVRFQLSTAIGFSALFLIASIFGIADGKPFAAIAILWVNIIMDGPPAMALAFDKPVANVMQQPPRPMSEPILTRRRWSAVITSSVTMAVGTLLVLQFAPGDPSYDTASVAGTMAFCTFVLFQFFNILNARNETHTVFNARTMSNWRLWAALGGAGFFQVLVTIVGPLQRLFNVTSLSVGQWLICAAVASSVVFVEEGRKLIVRASR
jgi:Ca2+-transporting ATPase